MQLLTEGQVAQRLQCTKAALRRWRREKRGPPFARIGRLVRYSEQELAAFIEAQTEGLSRPGKKPDGFRLN